MKQPWQITRRQVLDIVESGGTFIDDLGETWRFTGKKQQVGFTYLQEAINPKTKQRIQVTLRDVMDSHERAIKQRIATGKPVPAEVLAGYPELFAEALAIAKARKRNGRSRIKPKTTARRKPRASVSLHSTR